MTLKCPALFPRHLCYLQLPNIKDFCNTAVKSPQRKIYMIFFGKMVDTDVQKLSPFSLFASDNKLFSSHSTCTLLGTFYANYTNHKN